MMHKRVTQNSSKIKLVSILMLVTSTLLFASALYSADQGIRGKTSSGSVEISVTVNQTLNTVTPSEILLKAEQSKNSTVPFCVTHHGFNHDAQVPYELIVDSFKNANEPTTIEATPFNIYLQNESEVSDRQKLTKGLRIASQSNLQITKDIKSECINSGSQLYLEQDATQHNSAIDNTIGIMVLLISPT